MWFAGLWYQGITPARGNRRIGGIDIIQAGDQAFAIQNFPVIVIDDRDYITTLHGQVEENSAIAICVGVFQSGQRRCWRDANLYMINWQAIKIEDSEIAGM